ncbi:Rieske (2Fe-2S) protein [Kribbella sp. NPDC054772]
MNPPSRRTFLAGAAAGAAAGLTGCSKYGEPKGTPPPAPANVVLGTTDEIPVGGGKIFASRQAVVTQPVKGTFKGFSSICTHLGCPVASVSNGTINCDCHGSKYSIKDGSVEAGPAPRPLPPKPLKISGDTITLT